VIHLLNRVAEVRNALCREVSQENGIAQTEQS
jgi:hypothetical protein